MIIRNIAIMMLMLMVILIMPAAVHAHTLELQGAETTHTAGGGCHDADHDAEPRLDWQSPVRGPLLRT